MEDPGQDIYPIYPHIAAISPIPQNSYYPPPPIPERLPAWYRTDLTCAFHQGAPGHDVEHCYALKKEVQNLVRANLLSFRDSNPNVQVNPLPNHGSFVNMIQDYQEVCP